MTINGILSTPGQNITWYTIFILLKPSICPMECCLISCVWMEMWPSWYPLDTKALCLCSGGCLPYRSGHLCLGKSPWQLFFRMVSIPTTQATTSPDLKMSSFIQSFAYFDEAHVAEWEWETFSDNHQFNHLLGGHLYGLEIDWDLRPSTAVLAPGHTSPQAIKYKELCGTKNNCMHAQLGQILEKKLQKTKKPNCHFWRA